MRPGPLRLRRRLLSAAAALTLAALLAWPLLPRLTGIHVGDVPAILAALASGHEVALADSGYTATIGHKGSAVSVSAGSSALDPAGQRLKLGGGIEMTGHGGYRLRTDHADIDLVAGKVTSDAPIAASGPGGSIAADHFSVDDQGQVLRFGGRVRVTLTPPTTDQSQENRP
jgi:hypothetical protein